ncbi:PD-(D/E)XK nuclease family protein [Tetragenococcus halophilus]|uniref:PD-(D/E)XK nuclease family protein n=1 Tax=Tetragenococcus halophilus TaxID=51669 RepID=UPI000CAB5261|nr:PD-(D/E)XK nuclease family protein [Tetragenococcus halophilus]GBD62208.1 ATP-dependent nuclease subunit B [Tetragenococcus halophilus subsp. halophilus]GBD72743.1 ATP-dependent nuclease subunit B [Tetragenococcus halophilus subsp. halophilus]GBD75415.1 ATP-dependent nuclease subunit B [Tetragenococcus halophilus subsp. halophilus]GBD79915.1 ATP-dependent nuclease subunit B [Tetragenococcus halophilus subsp. halophilus]GFK21861.1 ATP-dependent helicase/nuclease subunit B [Tetragenococcus ha
MSLQFITGDGSCDHEKVVLDTACDWLANDHNEVFFLVPNYNKFEREQEILSQLKHRQEKKDFSTIRGQVYSFNRLAWYFLQDSENINGQTISDTGSAMIMRKVLLTLSDKLIIFRGEINKEGFIAKLLELYKEFQLGNITIDMLGFLPSSQETTKAKDFELKMYEIRLIFTAYEKELAKRNLQIEQPISMLTNFLAASDLQDTAQLNQKLFIVNGFSNFSMQEQELLKVLFDKSHVCIDLYVDSVHTDSDALDLFFDPKQTYHILKNFAQNQQSHVLFDKKAPLLSNVSASYLELERCFRQTNHGRYEQAGALSDHVEIWKAENPEEELRQVATEIRRLVSLSFTKGNKPLYYRDIQLLTLNPELYYSFIPSIFEELDIPFYLDEDRQMKQHPLVEFIQALFALDNYYYRTSDVFRFLRTELYIPKQLQEDTQDWQKARDKYRWIVDITENQALAHNFHGADWTREQDWRLFNFDFEKEELIDTENTEVLTNQLRNNFRNDIVSFFISLKAADTTKEAIIIFYQFLQKIGVEQQLIYWREQEIVWGNLEQARDHEQTWASLMDLLDELVEIYGEDPFDFDLFKEILSSGLENLTFGKVPTAIDQVQINPLDLTRPLQAKVTFAIGLDETSFPRTVENKSLISTEERQQLNENLQPGQYLKDQAEETIRKEPFVAYNMLLSASEKLYLSYPKNADSKQNIKMSSYLARILKWTDLTLQDRCSLDLTCDPHHYVGSYKSLIRQLNSLYRQAQEEKSALSGKWQSLKDLLLMSDYRSLATKVFESQVHRNVPVNLSPELAEQLYGKNIYSSISQIETFYDYQYDYFLKFGLGLKEREIYGLNSAMTGEIFHEALDNFLKAVFQDDLSLTQMSEEQRQLLIDRVLKNIFGQERYAFMEKNARMSFIRYRLGKTVQHVSWGLKKQAEKTQLTPVQTEVLFGEIAGNQGIPGLEIPLSNGGKLYLRGKIDRVDTTTIDGKPWLAVMDYKSSAHQFDITDSYYGLAMQLLTYLDIALKDAVELIGKKDVSGAGAYYFHVYDPILAPKKASEKERLKQYKLDGLFADDPEVFEAFDETLNKSEHSLVFPIQKDKNEQIKGSVRSKEKFYTIEEMNTLMAHNRKKLKEAAERILSGEIKMNPSYKMKDKRRATQYSPFRSISLFDPMLEENDYHRIHSLSKEEIMERLKEEKDD